MSEHACLSLDKTITYLESMVDPRTEDDIIAIESALEYLKSQSKRIEQLEREKENDSRIKANLQSINNKLYSEVEKLRDKQQ